MRYWYSLLILSIMITLFTFQLSGHKSDVITPKSLTVIRSDNIRSMEIELSWYKEQSKRILGESFKPGNLMSTTINLSSYNPLEEQCDSTPLIASDNGLVAPGILALPKHWRRLLNIDFGQIVWIPPYGQFVVRDHMNPRKKDGRGDIISFIPEWSKEFGVDNIATMYWVSSNTNNSQNK